MKKIIRITLIVALLGLFGYTLFFLYNKNQAPETSYQIETAETRDILLETVAAGKVVPKQEILIKPVVSGIIDKIYVEAGDIVQKGDLIARIKIIPNMVSLNNAENRVKQAQISLNNAQIDFDRNKQLYDEEVISYATFQPFQLALNNAKLEVEAADDNLLIIKEGISNSASSTSNTLVRSTIEGMVLDVPVEQGNQVIEANTFNEGTTIASIADLGKMIFEGFLDESEVGKVKEGMKIILTIGAIQDQTFPAELEYIAPKGTEKDGAMQFEIKAPLLKKDSTFIRAGYSANASIVLDKREQVVALNERLISFEEDSAFVFIHEGNQRVVKTPIQTGLSDGIFIEILDGIAIDTELRGKMVELNK
jgi:HlyD family secretion protein